MDQSRELITQLIHKDVALVQAWLEKALTNPQTTPKDFNWRHLAMALEVLAKSGQGTTTGKPDIEWTKVTVSVLEYLIRQEDSLSQIDLQDRIIELKAYCILHINTIPGDPFFDTDQLIIWFFQNLSFSFDEVETMLMFPKALTIMEVGALRKIKNRMRFLSLLVERKKLVPNEELKRWLAIREQLP